VQATVATPQQLAELMSALTVYINRSTSPEMFRILGEQELSFTQMKALFVLSEQEGMSVKDIASHLSMSVAAMSRSVDGLVQRGYVTRHECDTDRRTRRIALLPQGHEVLDKLLAARTAALATFAEELSDEERTALHAALLPIAERIKSL
jgi:DNA-binding MarR family transcriptional regulator